ncbi:MAG: GNAT family N-acetyltransferase, partial [Planctomycetes bacterium]|nr:GNAT family N-acetyltransferase [Planctomycetota bacterium]
MEFFPRVVTRGETEQFVARMQALLAARGHCYYAVEALDERGLLGFVGLAEQVFVSDFTPAVDIGWRLSRRAWGNGYATEGARRCLQHAVT